MSVIYLDTFMGQISVTKKGERISVEVVEKMGEDSTDDYLQEWKNKIKKNKSTVGKFLSRLVSEETFIKQIEEFRNGKINWMKMPKKTNWNDIIGFCNRLSTYKVENNNVIYMYKKTKIQLTYCNNNLYIAYNKILDKEEVISHIKSKFNFAFEDNNIEKYFDKTIFRNLIKKYYPVDEVYFNNLDECIVWAIISQLISTKAARTIFKRFVGLFNKEVDIHIFPSRNKILKLDDKKYIYGGISIKKINIIKDVLNYFKKHEIDKNSLNQKTEEEIRKELIKLKGIGPWTINLILLFLLRKENIFLPKDLGVQEGLKHYLNLEKRPTEKEAIKLVDSIDKYKSYLCIALWKIKRLKEKKKTSDI